MSLHNDPNYQIPALVAALKHHCLVHDTPSQLADAFRTGWVAAIAAASAQVAAPSASVEQEAMQMLWDDQQPEEKEHYRNVARGAAHGIT